MHTSDSNSWWYCRHHGVVCKVCDPTMGTSNSNKNNQQSDWTWHRLIQFTNCNSQRLLFYIIKTKLTPNVTWECLVLMIISRKVDGDANWFDFHLNCIVVVDGICIYLCPRFTLEFHKFLICVIKMYCKLVCNLRTFFTGSMQRKQETCDKESFPCPNSSSKKKL